VRTTVLVTRKNSPDGWIPKSIQYEHTVTRQNEFEGTVIVGCNAPYDPACMMPTAKNPPLLPDEYQWDVANQTTWRYFPFSVMIRVEGAE
jgi:hypothetical protein